MKEFSTNVHIYPSDNKNDKTPSLNFPITRGMSFITVNYKQLTPVFYSEVEFERIDQPTSPLPSGWMKYRALLKDGVTWLIYVNNTQVGLTQISQQQLQANNLLDGIVQITKLPKDDKEGQMEQLYDKQHGVYPIDAELDVEIDSQG